MKEVRYPAAMTKEIGHLRRKGFEIGFVPTMGALHEGHLSLIRKARKENDIVVTSIFVNPTQFGPKEDFKRYPRPINKDKAKLRTEKVDYLFAPGLRSMYSPDFSVFVNLENTDLTRRLCGGFRPGHFKGVATVVLKLFNIVQPDRAYFGAKDYQQSVVVRRLIQDLNLDIQFRLMPTVRERDGLALSSRNRYLNPHERLKALEISQTLFWIRDRILRTKKGVSAVRKDGLKRMRKALDRTDYLDVVDPETLRPLERRSARMVVAAAGYVGKTRLIDNVIINFKKTR